MQTGPSRRHYPLDAGAMARTCRKLAAGLRAEAAAGMGPIGLSTHNNQWCRERQTISRTQAAWRLDQQARRWQAEADGGERNVRDRRLIGEDW